MERIAPMVGGEGFVGSQKSGSLAGACLWVIVAAVFLCDALAVSINTDLRLAGDPAISHSARLAAQEAGRSYNWIAIGVCLVCLLIGATEGGCSGRALRALR